MRDALHPIALAVVAPIEDYPFVLGESTTPLLTDSHPGERVLIEGKITNLRIACGRISGRTLAAQKIFSFWRHVGPPRRSRGFVLGREVREGCVLPTIGGGLCQLSGSILEAGVRSGLEVVERHRHTALPDDIPYRQDRDATVFWNYVDLRLRALQPIMIEATVTASALVVRIRSMSIRISTAGILPVMQLGTPAKTLTESCYSCGQTNCVRHHAREGGN